MSLPALLRAPPFPWAEARLIDDEVAGACPSYDWAELCALVAGERVGGAFWAEPAALNTQPRYVVRLGSEADVEAVLQQIAVSDHSEILWIAPNGSRPWRLRLEALVSGIGGQWRAEVDPWSVLSGAESTLFVHGDDEWAALALLAGVSVRTLSDGAFGAADGMAQAAQDAVARALLMHRYQNCFTGEAADFGEIVYILSVWRRMVDGNRNIAVAAGMAWWKRPEISKFLWSPERKLSFARRAEAALMVAKKRAGAVAIWPSRVSPEFLRTSAEQKVAVVRVEDGFIRSLGLGVHLVPPSSVVVDHRGIHFDPRGPSDLEHILETAQMSLSLLRRAANLRERIVTAGISKYSADPQVQVAASEGQRDRSRRLVLVPGQVEDDMSVLAGSHFASNLELLKRARALEPDAEIWFRPHPDVDAGHRKGKVNDEQILQYADQIKRGGGMAPLLDQVDAVHVMTSLTGFEALLRGHDVTCHGTPFFAGWGLTRDLAEVPSRRTRRLSLDELVAGVLILYPRYLDPVTGLPCPAETLVDRMMNGAADGAGGRALNRMRWVSGLRHLQGRIMGMLR